MILRSTNVINNYRRKQMFLPLSLRFVNISDSWYVSIIRLVTAVLNEISLPTMQKICLTCSWLCNLVACLSKWKVKSLTRLETGVGCHLNNANNN